MPLKNNTQKIEELNTRVSEQIPLLEYQLKVLKENVDKYEKRVEKQEETLQAALKENAAQNERIKALEKGSDRRWQLAPILLSVAAVVLSIIFGVVNVLIAVYTKK